MGIEIFLWDQYVGALVHTSAGYAFQYHPKFRKGIWEISPILLPTRGKEVFVNEPTWKATGGIPGVIYDSLPDRFGSTLLSTYFAEKGIPEHQIDALAKLQYIGSRGMGALEFRPAMTTSQSKDSISIADLSRLAQLGTQSKESLRTNARDHRALLEILHIGTSAGGARAKALIAVHKHTGDIRSGQIPLQDGYEHFLIKIDGANQESLAEPSGYGRLEFTYYQMAKDCNIHMMECKLFANTHFMTRRFDRTDSDERLHAHSLCGLLGLDYNAIGEYSYDHLFMAARQLGLYQDTLEEIYRRLVFNVIAHNCDDHTKNFSFLMNPEGQWQLSPAFDLCYSYNSTNEWVSGHNMRINGKRKDINLEDLLAIGKKYNIKKRSSIIAHTREILSQFPDYALKNGVRTQLIEEVEKYRPRL